MASCKFPPSATSHAIWCSLHCWRLVFTSSVQFCYQRIFVRVEREHERRVVEKRVGGALSPFTHFYPPPWQYAEVAEILKQLRHHQDDEVVTSRICKQQLTFIQSRRMGSRKLAWSSTRRCLRSKIDVAMGLLPHVSILLYRLCDHPNGLDTQAKDRDAWHQIEARGLARWSPLHCLHNLFPSRHLLGWYSTSMGQLGYSRAVDTW